MGRRRSPLRPAAWRSLSSRYEVRFSSSMSVDGHFFDGLRVGSPPRTPRRRRVQRTGSRRRMCRILEEAAAARDNCSAPGEEGGEG